MAVSEQVTYRQLAELPLVKSYAEAFRQATGVALKLVPAGTPEGRVSLGTHENPFCQMVSGHEAIQEACWKSEAEALRRAGRESRGQEMRCFAGLRVLTAPVFLGGKHLATWIGGQVFCREPTAADFAKLAREMTKLGITENLARFKTAFYGTRVVPAERFRAMGQLLALFAQHLGEYADRLWSVSRPGEPPCVTLAKRFVEAHFKEEVTLKEVAMAAHLSQYHFCRVFHATTGVTFTEYLSRVRLDHAKTLLSDPAVRISEAAYASGFGSISQFNTVFRKFIGRSPTQFRLAPGGAPGVSSPPPPATEGAVEAA